MPSFSKAGAFLLFLMMTSAIITLTLTTTSVVASSVGRFERRVSNNKSNKKQGSKNKNEDDTCTMEPFLGTSQYTNCEGTEMEVKIACANKGNAAADGTLTKKSCSYSEQPVPVQYDDAAPAAVTAAGCGDHGSFDPETHLIRDHATGMCRLKFVALTNSCDAAPVVAGDGFGVMVVVLPSTGTGPGLHTHEQNEDNNHKDNSGMLLWFSTDHGVTFYNNQLPRQTVSMDKSSPRRLQVGLLALWFVTSTLQEDHSEYEPVEGGAPCLPACPGTFSGINAIRPFGDTDPFYTCYKSGSEYCWTKSYFCDKISSCGGTLGNFFQCVPNGDDWEFIEATHPDSCGTPCQLMHQKRPQVVGLSF